MIKPRGTHENPPTAGRDNVKRAEDRRWPRLVGLGRLYGLLGELFEDGFFPEATRGWPRAWREAVRTSGAAGPLGRASPDLLDAFRDARVRHEDAAAERSRLLLLGECPAYETAYAGPFARQRELADIQGFYRAFGLDAVGERGDHLSVECEFTSLLCVKEALARAGNLTDEADRIRNARKAFLRDHLGTWLSLYETDLSSRAELRLLPTAAAALRTLVRWDIGQLGFDLHEKERIARDDSEPAPACDPPAANAA